LVEVLDAHPELRILNEPFNENFTSWQAGNPNYRDRLVDRDGLDGVLADVFATYSGFKTLSFQVLGALLESLLLRSDLDVVVLRRRNLLEAVVSNLIALQTNLWKTWDADRPLEDYYTRLQPIAVSDVEHLTSATEAVLDRVDEIVHRRGDGQVLKLWYEDFSLGHRAQQRAAVNELWSFLGVEAFESHEIDWYLDPANVQMRAASTYGAPPNLDELNAALGSDLTGYLTYAQRQSAAVSERRRKDAPT
jgi:hypothetical protein